MASSVETPIQITYRGAEAKTEAHQMVQSILGAGLKVEPPTEVGRSEARLGAAEIIVTLILTSAFKSLAVISLDHLEQYLHSVAEKDRPEANLQIVLKSSETQRTQRFPVNLRQLTSEAIAKFFAQIRAGIEKL